ncbi:MAG: MBL fold metallo-hydrolase [Acidobacteria bacterium]|nr:MBL fold metallo-hydrolase [Acidobacteriota bacterium]MBI3279595.1 MBL fold metallo-hydrolase [Acidobacteriota bacterium]
MIESVLRDDAFLADVAAARRETRGLHLWWLGQSGFLIQWQGRHALLDPYLSDSLTKKYEHTGKPHVRMTARVVDPARLDFIDLVTSSHNHTDHLDAETLGPLLRANPDMKIVIPEANRAFVAERLQIDTAIPVGLDDGASATVKGFKIHGIAAAHEQLEFDGQGRSKFLGYVLQFGPWTVYHSGDAVPYEGLAGKLKRFDVDLALLPINGRNPERRVAGNFTGAEAARLAAGIGARTVVPCHFEMFEFNTASPDEFIAECERLGQRFRVLRAGERWTAI